MNHEADEPNEAHQAHAANETHAAHETHDAVSEREFEERVRRLLEEDAYAVRPAAAPYPAIRRRGVLERRRRIAAAGAALATLAVVPVGAYAVAGGDGGRGTGPATPMASVSTPHGTEATPTPAPDADGPARPATDGQLLDGVTYQQAADGLEKCLAYGGAHESGGIGKGSLGRAEDYRIVLAMRSTGDTNAPGDGAYVVAVKEEPAGFRVICTVKGGEASGVNTGTADAGADGAGPVTADINGGKLYQQSVLDKGAWRLPFRWGVIGRVGSSVAKVTVSYGDSSATAALDHGWFVAAGVLGRQVTAAPHIKGYDAAGQLVYDSDTDATYGKTLP
ncbi:hypothetical protein [Streptomyces sp. NPDC059894]|uniref:hypothetical protein n=1 Tax=unclassified Streptomyces TaxID=2593676 RepID=UPI0036491724